jgi:hypothetical protein
VSIFAFLSLGLIPIPLIFIRYGKELRDRSRYAQEAHVIIMRMGEYNYGESESTTTMSVQRTVTELPPIAILELGDLESASA